MTETDHDDEGDDSEAVVSNGGPQTAAETVRVSESKFNGTATLDVDATTKERAEAAAKQYFRDVHGSDPSKVVAEENPHRLRRAEQTAFTVMVADHSSGSLCSDGEYTF